jgi:hypothetical protein
MVRKNAMWLFDQPPNSAMLTSSRVMRDGRPITFAYHDESDHGWQFFSDEGARAEEGMIVALGEIVKLDPSVMDVADLPPGWMAQRESLGAPWHRTLQFADAAQIVVDWSQISSREDFYDVVFQQCGSPPWHGRNLDGLADSWVTGGINQHGPPYAFAFSSLDATP